jgi:3-oxoacyl-[acyl-carrier protein] reductase
MDLGIAGRSAIVCSAATDLGRACAIALAEEGVQVTAADDGPLHDLPAGCRTVNCDIRVESGRASLLNACPEPDILINHAPGPPMGDFRQWSKDDWHRALNANMLAAIDLIKGVLDGMTRRGFGRIINITSQSVRAPMANLDLSNAARAGLTGFVGGVARERRDADVTINNLLPGLFDTVPLRRHAAALTKNGNLTESEIMAKFAADVPLARIGRPEEFGAICAYLCGRQAGFVNGQNILVDGGAFPGLI